MTKCRAGFATGTIKRILPGSSSPSYRKGPGTEVDIHQN